MEIPALLKNKSLIWSTLGVLVLVVGIFVALQLIPQEQDLRQEAAQDIPAAIGEIKINPTTMDLSPNQEKTVTVQVNTKGLKAGGISAVLSYPYTGTTPSLAASDIVMSAPFNADPWTCPVKKIEPRENSILIQVACVISGIDAPNGYQSGALADFFTFKLKAAATPNQTKVLVSFNESDTSINTIDENAPDLASVDALNSLTVNLVAGPPAEKKITVTSPTISCGSNDFTVSAEVTEGTTKKPNVAVTFTYNGQTKQGTTNETGQAAASFPKAGSTMNVTAEATGYTTGTVAATLPDCDDDDDDDDSDANRLSLSLSGLTCGGTDFTAKATTVNVTNKSNIPVQFSYNGENKTANTNGDGEAQVTFIRATSNSSVRATAPNLESDSETATLPSNCSGSTTGLTCNQSCDASRSCQSGLSCISGYCRASQCSSDTSCGCADLDVAGQNGTTQLPQSGFDQTLALTVLGLLFLLGGGQLWWSRRALSPSNADDHEEQEQ